jgi:glycoprotein-N-acetylgalactosamine 3-beta-galactosyltransferase
VSVLPKRVRAELDKFNTSANFLGEPVNLLQPREWDDENYDNLTQKVLLAFRDIYKEYGDYNWYLKADDDTFIQNENLNAFLRQRDPNIPATYGFDFDFQIRNGYPSGGAGYVLSNKAFRLLGQQLATNMSFCQNLTGTEDYDLGACLRTLNVNSVSTSDELGRERFNVFELSDHYFGTYPDWYLNRTRSKTVGFFTRF